MIALPVKYGQRRFGASESGASALEFAIVLPLLLILIFGIITFGWVFYLLNNMETAAREGAQGARRMAVAEAPFAGSNVTCASQQAQTVGTAEHAVCNSIVALSDSPDVTVNASTLCPAEQVVRVTVSIAGEDVALADFLGLFDNKFVGAKVEMRREEPCA
jgi:Flp pilus assembly protein TadG